MANGDNIQAMLDSLKNPRYATSDPQANAPIEMDGTLDGTSIVFVAHPHDTMPYGVDTWNKAQAGHYGVVSPFNPTLETVQKQAAGWGSLTASIVSREAGLGDTALAATLESTPVLNGKASDKHLSRVSKLWGVSSKQLPTFIENINEFRFSIVEAVAELKQSVSSAKDKAGVKAALDAFSTELNEIVATYNSTNPPKKITNPAKIVIPGL